MLIGLVSLAALAAPAVAADYGNATPGIGYSYRHGVLPECSEPSVLARISEKFAYQDAHITLMGVAITNIDSVHEDALKSGGPGLIDRRYCGGTAWLSDGRQSEVVYLIEGPKLGFASIGWHVESCLPAVDPYRVYDARCRSIRP